MLRSCWSSASERKKKSMGRFSPRGVACGTRCSSPRSSDMSLLGRDDVDVIGLDRQADPSPAAPASRSPAAAARPACPCAWGRGAGRRRRPCRCRGGRSSEIARAPRARRRKRRSRRRGTAPVPAPRTRARPPGPSAGRARRGERGAFGGRRASFGRAPSPSPCTRARRGRWLGHTRRLFRRALGPASAPALRVLGQCTTPWF